jgi:glucose-6-phosphate 1-epimerase
LSLADDEETRSVWNHNFELVYNVVLTGNSLQTQLVIKNTGSENFEFTSLLHTYFGVEAIKNVKVYDLNNLEFIDKVTKLSSQRFKSVICYVSFCYRSKAVLEIEKHVM